MPTKVRSLAVLLAVVAMTAAFLTAVRKMPGQVPATRESIACRVIESKTAETLGVALVVFHHAEAASREPLSAFLENHDGARVEFQTAGGDWQPATVFRLKNCFGRGLLAFPAQRVSLARDQTFLIRERTPSQ